MSMSVTKDRIDPVSRPQYRLRLLAVYIVTGALSTWFWLSHDFTHVGVPHLDMMERMKLAAISLTGPFAMPLMYRLSQFDMMGYVMALLNVVALALAFWRPSFWLTRWLGYVGIAWWVVYGTAVAYIPF